MGKYFLFGQYKCLAYMRSIALKSFSACGILHFEQGDFGVVLHLLEKVTIFVMLN